VTTHVNILNAIKRAFTNEASTGPSVADVMDLFSTGRGALGPDLSEVTYFTCIKTLAESLGKLPLNLMDSDKRRVTGHESTRFLTVEPNAVMTPVQFFTTLEYHRNHFGNGYAYIAREQSRLTGLHILPPNRVQVWVNNTEQFTRRRFYYLYTDAGTGGQVWIEPEDMLHVRSWITEESGLVGKSVREILAESMQGNKASQDFLNKLYEKGLTANAVIKYVGDLNEEGRRKLLRSINAQSRDESRRMIALPVGCDIQTIDLKLTDSQFYELRKYNALQVAAAFGIMPNHLNDYSKSSYANSAMQNLQFYVDTLLYNISIYEQELNRKLLTSGEQRRGLGFKFNVWVILRGDPSSQADVLQKLVSQAVYSPNEARAKLDMEPCANGDVHLVNGAYVKLEDIGLAYGPTTSATRGGESNAEDQKQG